MKSRLFSIFFVVFLTVSFCAVTAHAAYSTSGKFPVGNYYAINLSPPSASYDYYNNISYDSLSQIAVSLNSSDSNVSASVVFNSVSNCYVVRASTSSILGGTYSVVGSSSGYVYVCPENATLPVVNRILGYLDSSLSSVSSKLDIVSNKLQQLYNLLNDTFRPFLARIVTASEDTITIVRATYLWLQNGETGLPYYLNMIGVNGTNNITHIDRIYNLLHDSINSLLSRITSASESTNTMVRASYFLLNDNLTTSLTTINQSIQALGSTGSGTVTNNWTVDNSDVISRIDVLQSALMAKLDTMSTGVTTSIDNTVVNITNTSDKYNVFYVTDPEGNTKSVVDLSGDLLGVGGKLLDFLYKAVFSGALDNSGDALGNMSDFYLGTGEGSGDIWGS
ncbi:MAG: hypothetical protein GXW99_01140 [Clostridiales bacterium]|nr:hypothetical protein [Clostridiales bacterium]